MGLSGGVDLLAREGMLVLGASVGGAVATEVMAGCSGLEAGGLEGIVMLRSTYAPVVRLVWGVENGG